LGNLPRQPRCTDCPMRGLCVAERQGQTELDPVKSRSLSAQVSACGCYGPSGLTVRSGSSAVRSREFGGLYCLPVYESSQALLQGLPERLRPTVQEQPTLDQAPHRREGAAPTESDPGACASPVGAPPSARYSRSKAPPPISHPRRVPGGA
jgi:adenine-specific DNA glycosylase